MRYQIARCLIIELDADSVEEAAKMADEVVECFDLTQDIDATIGCNEVGDAQAWVHDGPAIYVRNVEAPL